MKLVLEVDAEQMAILNCASHHFNNISIPRKLVQADAPATDEDAFASRIMFVM
jgi:hypothetical protein